MAFQLSKTSLIKASQPMGLNKEKQTDDSRRGVFPLGFFVLFFFGSILAKRQQMI
jgi:hypothetical protein